LTELLSNGSPPDPGAWPLAYARFHHDYLRRAARAL